MSTYRRISGLSSVSGGNGNNSMSRNVTPVSNRSNDSIVLTTPASGKSVSKSFPIYIAINEYHKRMEDELDFRPGDKIQVLLDDEEYNDGWYYGKNLRTHEEGLYPVVFTQEIKMERKYPLTRAKSIKRSVSNDNILQQHQPSQQGESNNFLMADIDTALQDMKDGMPVIATGPADETMVTNTSALNISDNNSDEDEDEYDIGEPVTLNPKFEASWSPSQVAQYFQHIGFNKDTTDKFEIHKISGAILLEMELSYLKELDIDSFGTRFEIFKEIENLKNSIADSDTQRIKKQSSNPLYNDFTNNSRQLMPPANLENSSHSESQPLQENPNQVDTRSFSKGHEKKSSRSLDDLPSTNPSNRSNINSTPINNNSRTKRPTSMLIKGAATGGTKRDELAVPKSVSEIANDTNTFASPRRAPKPPSYPSPVQPPKSPSPYNLRMDPSNQTKSSPMVATLEESEKDEEYLKDDTFAEIMRKVSKLAGDTSEEMEGNNQNNKSETSSIYTEVNETLPLVLENKDALSSNSASKESKRNSYISSPNKKTFTNYAPKSSPKGTETKENLSFTSKILSSSPLKSPAKKYGSFSTKDAGKRRSLSAQDITRLDNDELEDTDELKNRVVSEAMKNKSMKKISATRLKTQTTAFTEGLRSITVQEAMKDADCSGWMNKKGSSAVGIWSTRFFTLHGTRLSYFGSTTDTRERGLIDITGHRVVPAREDDKLVSLYAASTGKGRYCFKLIPPQPGSKKGLTFTQPKIHYFAVDSKEEMRTWMAHLIKTTIDIDTSVPVVSSYTTPTVSLGKAQEMLTEAREANRVREEQSSKEYDENKMLWDQQNADAKSDSNSNSNLGTSTFIGSPIEKKDSSKNSTPVLKKLNSRTFQGNEENDTRSSVSNPSSINNKTAVSSSMGFSSPYLLASGMSTPNIVRSNSMRAKERVSSFTSNSTTKQNQQEDYFGTVPSKYLSENKL